MINKHVPCLTLDGGITRLTAIEGRNFTVLCADPDIEITWTGPVNSTRHMNYTDPLTIINIRRYHSGLYE